MTIGEKCGSRCSLICGDDRILGKADWIVPPRWGEWSIGCPVVDKAGRGGTRNLARLHGLFSSNRSINEAEWKLDERGVSASQGRGECLRVCNRNPRTGSRNARGAYSRIYKFAARSVDTQQRCCMDPLMDSLDGRTIERRTITLDQSGLESRWNFFFLPFSRFPPPAPPVSSPRVQLRNATWLVNNNFEWKKKVFVRLKGTVEQALHLVRLDLIETNQWRGT